MEEFKRRLHCLEDPEVLKQGKTVHHRQGPEAHVGKVPELSLVWPDSVSADRLQHTGGGGERTLLGWQGAGGRGQAHVPPGRPAQRTALSSTTNRWDSEWAV